MEVICPDCGAHMKLRVGPFKYKDGRPRSFWGCTRYPDCTAAHGAHPDGTPLGTPANKETKEWRIKAHEAFDQLWLNKITMTRRKAYKALAKELGLKGEAHIGAMDIEGCKAVIEAVNNIKKR